MTSPFDYLNALAALETPDGVIAVATDVGFCLAGLPNHPEALARIRRLQPDFVGVTLVGHSREAMSPFIGEMSLQQASAFQSLMKAHWPGLLTCIVPALGKVSGEPTVGIRIPDYPFLTEFTQMLPEQVLLVSASSIEKSVALGLGCFVLGAEMPASGGEDTVVSVAADGVVAVVRPGMLDLGI